MGQITITHKGDKLTLKSLELQHKVIDHCMVIKLLDKQQGVMEVIALPIRMSIERAKRYVAMNKLGEFYAAL